jgi:hypothetical protein
MEFEREMVRFPDPFPFFEAFARPEGGAARREVLEI